MIGIDITQISRFEKVDSSAFRHKVFLLEEREYLKKQNSLESVAGMYCAKEAVLKALGSGIGNGVGFSQIKITHNQFGQPEVELFDNAKALLETLGQKIFVSITHDAGVAVAVAVIK